MAVAVGVLAVGGWFWGMALNELPPPRFLSAAELVGTWSAEGDGRLVLRADGTFEAVGVCGAGRGSGLGSLVGSWQPRAGSCSAYDPDFQTGGITLSTPGGGEELEEGTGDDAAPLLWMYRGVPGQSGVCALRRS